MDSKFLDDFVSVNYGEHNIRYVETNSAGFDVKPLLSVVKNYDLEHCYCLDPQVIINPKLPELLIRYHVFYLNGNRHVLFPDDYSVFNFNFAMFKCKDGMSIDEINSSYVLDEVTGEIYPIYFLVPCGHCLICNDAKLNRFANKCLMESQLYKSDPIHVTLTYSPKFLPEGANVCYDDVCKFKKRLRENLKRHGYYSPIRMVDSAEYGEKRGRPHYHVIIWGLDCSKIEDFYAVRKLVFRSWKKSLFVTFKKQGFRLINDSYIPKGSTKSLKEMGISPDNVFKYIAKYIYKGTTPSGKQPVWLHASRGSAGGIGAPFLDKHMVEIRKRRKGDFKFRDFRSGKLVDLVYDRYVINRCFPSRYTSLPYKLRKSILMMSQIAPFLSSTMFKKYLDVKEKFQKYFFIPNVTLPDLKIRLNDNRLKFDWIELLWPVRSGLADALFGDLWNNIYKYMYVDFSYVLPLEAQRRVLLAELFPPNKDKPDRVRVVEKICKNNIDKRIFKNL